MPSEILIQTEKQNHGYWLHVFIPYHSNEVMNGILQSESGEIIKRVTLQEGNNSIDISNINSKTIAIKIETAFETILKNLNLS